jgi:nicotinate-nucleotide pyrophosphorylase (carboxylating)
VRVESDLRARLDALIQSALEEDLGRARHDVTSEAVIKPAELGEGEIRAKSDLVLCGTEAAHRTFEAVEPTLRFEAVHADGDLLSAGDVAARVAGPLRAILSGERTALNFLQRLSGVATLTAKFVEAVRGTKAVIVDTRKTTPGWRALEKYAVRCGGGTNHRLGLYDAVLLKDNHVRAAGGVPEAILLAREGVPGVPIEIEVTTIAELEEAIAAGVERVLLDNMDIATLRLALKRASGKVSIEASGGVTLQNVRAVAECGVDFISVGALTHSAPAADLSLELVKP